MRLAGVLVLCLVLATPAWSVTFTAQTTVDAVDAAPGDGICAAASGDCTLRAAIQEANTLPSDDAIDVPAGTYVLTLPGIGEDASASGDLDVISNGDLEIRGAGATATIVNGNGLDRVLETGIFTGSAASVLVADLTIENGAGGDGAGIRSMGILTLQRVIVRNNHSTGAGGGIYTVGTLSVRDSTIVGNSAINGGAALLGGFLTFGVFANTTVSANSATADGGAFFSVGFTSPVLRNATVTGNIADSDGDGVGDGGAVADSGILTVLADNTIVAGNVDVGGEAPNLTNQVVIGLDNLIGGDPMLGPLQDNGGPTPTHALLAASPALDAGNPGVPGSGGSACEATDQRGIPRPQGPACDIGAFEARVGDHFKCYLAKDLKNPKFPGVKAELVDQFGVNDGDFEVKKPFLMCTPVDKNGEGIDNPDDHLTCYKIKGPKLEKIDRPQVEVVNQLGTLQLEAKKPFLLCVPSAKTVLP